VRCLSRFYIAGQVPISKCAKTKGMTKSGHTKVELRGVLVSFKLTFQPEDRKELHRRDQSLGALPGIAI
jgi:hypothetical protein